jgi:mono/diheme cytochrome c family protein
MESGHWFSLVAVSSLTCGFLLLVALAGGSAWAAEGSSAGKRVYEKANCVGCHKWHGGGGGGYGGAALSLRETELDRAQLIEVIRCGRPATGMPHHDRTAWRDADASCYGTRRSELGDDVPPRAATFLRDEEIEAVVDYVQAAIQGKGEPIREDCTAFWGEASRQCDSMQ